MQVDLSFGVTTHEILGNPLSNHSDRCCTPGNPHWGGCSPLPDIASHPGSAIQTASYGVDSGMIGEITSCYCALSRNGEISVRA